MKNLPVSAVNNQISTVSASDFEGGVNGVLLGCKNCDTPFTFALDRPFPVLEHDVLVFSHD